MHLELKNKNYEVHDMLPAVGTGLYRIRLNATSIRNNFESYVVLASCTADEGWT